MSLGKPPCPTRITAFFELFIMIISFYFYDNKFSNCQMR
jgi:hypothetical protein